MRVYFEPKETDPVQPREVVGCAVWFSIVFLALAACYLIEVL